MAGHSKWKSIKHYKAATDAKRGAKFTKLIREITVAAKFGGGDPGGNPRLRTAIDTAKAASMPRENIERAVKKGTGELEGVDYVEVLYEAYGPGGVALMIQALTDNATRTVAEVRAKLSRGGGNLGATNSVAFMFDRKGQLYIDAAGKRRRVREKRAIRDPYHSMMLLWLDRWKLKDLTLLVGLRVTRTVDSSQISPFSRCRVR